MSTAAAMSTTAARPAALTIAGFDPSSGAGITADLAVFEANGCFGISAITALTVQSTTGVRRVHPVDEVLLAETLQCLDEDLPPNGIKIGMLANAHIVSAVSGYLRGCRTLGRCPIVVLDPVLVSSSGRALLDHAGVDALQRELLPLVDLVTPNVAELAVLSGQACGTATEIEKAMRSLSARFTALSVIATGGHREQPDDLVLHQGVLTTVSGRWVETRSTHGTGCAFSSALLAHRLLGADVVPAAECAKRYVEGALTHAEGRGQGRGPMRLLWPLV